MEMTGNKQPESNLTDIPEGIPNRKYCIYTCPLCQGNNYTISPVDALYCYRCGEYLVVDGWRPDHASELMVSVNPKPTVEWVKEGMVGMQYYSGRVVEILEQGHDAWGKPIASYVRTGPRFNGKSLYTDKGEQ